MALGMENDSLGDESGERREESDLGEDESGERRKESDFGGMENARPITLIAPIPPGRAFFLLTPF